MNNLRSKIVSFISYFLVFSVVILVVLHFIFGFQYVVILTNSMQPTINPGDLVITRPVPPSELHVGDIILYEVHLGNATYKITHRIVAIRTDKNGRYYFLTKGDNRKYIDPWRVYPDQVIGKVIFIIPGLGRVWYYTPIIVLLIFMFIIGSLAYDLALELLEPFPVLSKAKRPTLWVVRRKKIKVHYHRRKRA